MRSRLGKHLEKRARVVKVGEEGLSNEDVTAGEEESETVHVGGHRVEDSEKARRLLIVFRGTIGGGTSGNDPTSGPVTVAESRKRLSSRA